MPKWGTQDYKDAIFQQLSQGSGADDDGGDHFQHFENFSSGAPREHVEAGIHEAFHPERIASDEIQPKLLQAAEKMQPNERSEISRALMSGLEQRGLAPSWLQRMLGLGSDDPDRASPDDVAKLTEYSRQNHPEVFRSVMAEKPALVRWLDKPLVAALVGVIAGKLLNRQYDK